MNTIKRFLISSAFLVLFLSLGFLILNKGEKFINDQWLKANNTFKPLYINNVDYKEYHLSYYEDEIVKYPKCQDDNNLDKYRIALVLPKKSFGDNIQQIKKGIRNQAEELNEKCALFAFEVVEIDEDLDYSHNSSQNTGVKIPDVLSNDPNIIAVLGYSSSLRVVKTVKDRFNNVKLPLILPVATNSKLLSETSDTDKTNYDDYIFRSTVKNTDMIRIIEQSIKNENIKSANIAVIGYFQDRESNQVTYSYSISEEFRGLYNPPDDRPNPTNKIDLEDKLGEIEQDIANFINNINRIKQKTAIVIFPDSENSPDFSCDISLKKFDEKIEEKIKKEIDNESKCKTVKLINYINSLPSQNKPSIYTGDSFYTFTAPENRDVLHNNQSNLATINVAVPTADCENDLSTGWRNITSQNAVFLLNQAINELYSEQNLNFSQKSISDQRIDLRNKLAEYNPNGEIDQSREFDVVFEDKNNVQIIENKVIKPEIIELKDNSSSNPYTASCKYSKEN